MTSSDQTVPSGQVACLLCRGFISVADGDRARFVDHMHSEHEVKHEPEVVLAVSVLTPREKLFLIKTAAARLEAIGRGGAPVALCLPPSRGRRAPRRPSPGWWRHPGNSRPTLPSPYPRWTCRGRATCVRW